MTAIIAFSLLLTIIFVLYQPSHGPGERQKLGWQSWATVSPSSGIKNTSDSISSGPADVSEGVDWWDVIGTDQPTVDSASLPLDEWDPASPHDTGIAEVSLEQCYINPDYFPRLCDPPTTTQDDAVKGKWVRVRPDLNRQGGWTYLNIYYRRTRRLDIPLITDLKLLGEGEEPSPMSDAWHKASKSVRAGVPRTAPLYLWYKAGKTAQEMTEVEKRHDLITELDVLYGEDTTWYGFDRLEPPTTEQVKNKIEGTYITYRRGVKRPPRAPPLHFSKDGRFRILQVADLHFSVSQGTCRDTILSPCEHSDNLTSTLLGRILDEEQPNMVVFTGDQLNGQGTSWDVRTVLAKFAKTVTDRHIPWAAIFGNHDEEDGDSKRAQLRYMQGLPYSLIEQGPPDIHGVGNYVLKVKSADASMTHLLTLYFLDSGSYSKSWNNWFGYFTPTEYDWIHEDQISWFLQESGSINAIERPFSPDGGKDSGDLWKRQGIDQVTPSTLRLAKPNALMFFHIPLQEAFLKPDINPATGKPLDVGLHGLEGKGTAKTNGGFFEKGLMNALESDHRAGGGNLEVKVVANGHCHITENCRRVRGIWLCFGGGGSYSGYGKIGFDRRFRVYDISDFGETIRTYKRTENDKVLDEMVLAGPDAPPPYEGT